LLLIYVFIFVNHQLVLLFTIVRLKRPFVVQLESAISSLSY